MYLHPSLYQSELLSTDASENLETWECSSVDAVKTEELEFGVGISSVIITKTTAIAITGEILIDPTTELSLAMPDKDYLAL